ncbi:MAG: hypothetical protein ACU843_07415 [Gammaproteobacteria bacterium]
MSAQVSFPADYDASAIILAAGGSPDNAVIRNGILHIGNITQSALDQAMADYALTATQNKADRAAAEAVRQINDAAGVARMKYITDSPGQAEIYMFKDQQARAYKAAGYTGTVPEFVQAEANASQSTTQAAADFIIAQADVWIATGAAIDEARRTGLIAVEAARVAGDAATISSAMVSAIQAIQAL